MCNYHLGQYEEAIAHYDIAKSKHEQNHGDGPLLGQILYNRGLAYSSLMRFENAIADQKAAIEATGDGAKIFKMLFQLGITLRRVANHGATTQEEKDSRIEESIEKLRKACELQPNEASAHNNLGLSYFENEEFENAL